MRYCRRKTLRSISYFIVLVAALYVFDSIEYSVNEYTHFIERYGEATIIGRAKPPRDIPMIIHRASTQSTPISEEIKHFPNRTIHLPFGNPDLVVYDTESRDWWTKISEGEWEPTTIRLLQNLSHPDAIILDLGGWIGVTAIAAALRGATVFSFEPDPYAYAEMISVIAANPAVEPRISIDPLCISDIHGVVPMKGFPADSSGSMMPKMQSVDGQTWNVTCVPLRWVLETMHIPTAKIAAVKMDIEGAEELVLPQIVEILEEVGYPPVLLSVHSYAWYDIPAAQAKLLSVFRRYQYVYDAHYIIHASSEIKPVDISDAAMFVLSNHILSIAKELEF